jgi:hypothetical protein
VAKNPKIRRPSLSTGSSISDRSGRKLELIFYTYASRRCNNSGNLAILTAMRLASSLLSNLAADLRPGSSSK